MKFEVFWKNEDYKIRRELRENIDCDYLIVGGGITGVSVAYFLSRLGAKNIVLIEKHYIGSGASGKAAGTLAIRGERDLLDIIEKYGKEKGARYWRETHAGLRDIKKIIDEERITCDAEIQDTLYCGFKHKTFGDLHKEYEAEKSIENTTKLLEGKDFKKEINTDLFTHGILSMHHGLSVNPLKLVQGLSCVTQKYGVKIYENTALLRNNNGKAETHRGDIQYKKIILAIDTDYPEDEIKNLKTTVVITKPLTQNELVDIGFGEKKKIVFDSRKNENYFKVTEDRRLLFGFGGIVVHKKHRGTDPHFPHLKQLRNFIKKVFPNLNLEVEYAWSGHFGVRQSSNKLLQFTPFIQIQDDSVAISGAGSQVTCFMAAKYVASTILGKKSSLKEFFDNS